MSGRKGVRSLAGGVTIAMIVAVALGLWTMGSPSHQRALRLDGVRMKRLYSLGSMVELRYSTTKTLPSTLDELGPNNTEWLDPVSGQLFEYNVTGPKSFRMCATFAASSDDMDQSGLYVFPRGAEWKHPAGHFCFDRPIKVAAETVLN